MHTRAREDEVVIVEDAMKEVLAKDVSEDVNVDVEVVVDEVVFEDVEDEQVGICDANVNEEVVVEDDVLEDGAKCSSAMLLLRKLSLNPSGRCSRQRQC